MTRKRLTARFVESVRPPKQGRAAYLDSVVRGFGLRVTSTGHKSWFLNYRKAGRMRRWTIGGYPAMPLVTAREKADTGLREIAQGGDPAGGKADSHRAPTFKQMAHAYIERWAKPNKRTWRKDRAIIARELVSRFGSRKAASIQRGEIREAFDAVSARAPVAANRMLEIAKRLWNWALEVDYPSITANPCTGVKKAPERKGARWLKPSEVAAVWAAMDALPARWGAFCKLCLLTGQHPGEILAMRRDQVERSHGGAWWIMPEGHHKADWSHSVFLAPLALEAFEAACAASRGAEHAFPARGGGAASPDNNPWRRAVEALSKAAGVPRFTARDFRPTVATGMASEPLSISQAVIAKVLGHANPAITETYVRHGYDGEKRRAMLSWERRVIEIATGEAGGKVVAMPGIA